jgi:hypothetical protein
MNMIGHHYPGMDIHHIFFCVLGEPSDICPIVFLGSEADLTIIAALNDMNRNIDW